MKYPSILLFSLFNVQIKYMIDWSIEWTTSLFFWKNIRDVGRSAGLHALKFLLICNLEISVTYLHFYLARYLHIFHPSLKCTIKGIVKVLRPKHGHLSDPILQGLQQQQPSRWLTTMTFPTSFGFRVGINVFGPTWPIL